MSLTYKETMDQYKALQKTFKYVSEHEDSLCSFISTHKPKSITFIGSGSSYCISQSFEMMAKIKMGISATSIPAGDLMLHYKNYSKMLEDTLLVTVSRSGSTSEIIESINSIKEEISVPVLSVSCVEDSELSKISDMAVEIPWAFDNSICQTRTVSNMYAAVLQIIAYWSNNNRVIHDLKKMIDSGDAFLAENEAGFKSVGGMEWKNAVVLADGELHGIATEGALALKEIAQVLSNSYHLMDSRHGPMVMINKDTLVIACITEDNTRYQRELIKDVIHKGAKVIIYSDVPTEEIEGAVLHVTSNLSMDYAVQGVPFINISQLIAYNKAVLTGVNPDKPEGLDAWIRL